MASNDILGRLYTKIHKHIYVQLQKVLTKGNLFSFLDKKCTTRVVIAIIYPKVLTTKAIWMSVVGGSAAIVGIATPSMKAV